MRGQGSEGSAAVSQQQPHSWQLEGQQYLDPKRASGQLTASLYPGSCMCGSLLVSADVIKAGNRKKPENLPGSGFCGLRNPRVLWLGWDFLGFTPSIQLPFPPAFPI